jgi:hypothetical protein
VLLLVDLYDIRAEQARETPGGDAYSATFRQS